MATKRSPTGHEEQATWWLHVLNNLQISQPYLNEKNIKIGKTGLILHVELFCSPSVPPRCVGTKCSSAEPKSKPAHSADMTSSQSSLLPRLKTETDNFSGGTPDHERQGASQRKHFCWQPSQQATVLLLSPRDTPLNKATQWPFSLIQQCQILSEPVQRMKLISD